MTLQQRKRFYKTAVVAADAAGFTVTLDGRPLRTPGGAAFVVPTAALARAVAEEWLAQDGEIRPQTMPQTRLCATAIDRVGPARAAVVDHVAAYGASDLLCYRAEEPGELAARQHRCWQPLLDWAKRSWGVRLEVTRGVMPVSQPPDALAQLRDVVAGHDDLELTALACAVPACGSLILGLALTNGRLCADETFHAAQIDETFQIERWGEDDEQTERRRALKADIDAAAGFLARVRDTGAAA